MVGSAPGFPHGLIDPIEVTSIHIRALHVQYYGVILVKSKKSIDMLGHGFLASGCICSLYLKCIFNILKNVNIINKIFVYIFMSYVSTKWL
jgi:hypothetical protein